MAAKGFPKEAPEAFKRPQEAIKNNTEITSQVDTAKTSKITTISKKINKYSCKKLRTISQKRSQNEENEGKIAHHEATLRTSAPSTNPGAPTDASKEVGDLLSRDLRTYFSAGGPQGRPRARGVYLINQVMKE